MTAAETARLGQLIPACRARVEEVIAAMGARGFGVYVGQTLRSDAQQHEAQARGTTSAHQSRSWHQLGRAADLRARHVDGTPDETTHNEPFFRALYEEAGKIGLRSLAYHLVDGKLEKLLLNGKTWDAGHVEWRFPHATLDEAFAAEGPK